MNKYSLVWEPGEREDTMDRTYYDVNGDLQNFTSQQLKMIEVAGRLWKWQAQVSKIGHPMPGSLPDLEGLCCHWYMEVSPAIPLYSIMCVYNWLKETGYYDPLCL